MGYDSSTHELTIIDGNNILNGKVTPDSPKDVNKVNKKTANLVDDSSIMAIAHPYYPEEMCFTITYDPSDWVDGVLTTPKTVTKRYGVTIAIEDIYCGNGGKRFLGWAQGNDLETVVYRAGQQYTGNKDLYLYGVWGDVVDIPTVPGAPTRFFEIAYDANGGSGTPETETVKEGLLYTISTVAPVRSGYTFRGWAEADTSAEAEYQPGASVKPTGNMTLYAVWKKNTTSGNYGFHLTARTQRSATVSVKNNNQGEITASLILAAYDGEGRMVSCIRKEINLAAGATKRATISFDASVGVSEIRGPLADTDTLEPLCKHWITAF